MIQIINLLRILVHHNSISFIYDIFFNPKYCIVTHAIMEKPVKVTPHVAGAK